MREGRSGGGEWDSKRQESSTDKNGQGKELLGRKEAGRFGAG